MPDSTTLTREQIAEILGRHDGAKAEVSRRAGVAPSNTSKWLAGAYVSANVAGHALAYARELLAREEAERIAAQEANGPSARQLLNEVLTKGVDDPSVAPIIEKLKKPPTEE